MNVLDQHPGMSLAPETNFLDRWAPRYRDVDLNDPAEFERFWADFAQSPNWQLFGLPEEVGRTHMPPIGARDLRSIFVTLGAMRAREAGKVRWGEKTPSHFRHLPEIFEWFHDARVIFMIRDARDVVLSHKRLKQEWVKRAGTADVIARRWRAAAAVATRYRDDERVLVMRYEDLTSYPDAEVRRICHFVGLDFDQSLLDRPGERARVHPNFPTLDPRLAIANTSIGGWRDGLAQHETRVIEQVAGNGLREFGYEVVGRPKLVDRVVLAGYLLRSALRSAAQRTRR